MKKTKNSPSNPDSPPRRIVPDRGSISGSGEGMSDAEALAILRKKEPRSARENPDIEVVVGAEPLEAQTKFPVEILGDEPTGIWAGALTPGEKLRHSNVAHFKKYLEKRSAEPSRIFIEKVDLNSPVKSLLDQMSALWLAEQAWGKGESLRMRLLLDKSTIDLDLPRGDPDALEASIHDLIDRSLD